MSGQTRASGIRRDQPWRFGYERVVDDISSLNWTELGEEDLISVAWAYYFFSVQFRECLESACTLYPGDERLQELDRGERNTGNLSPWPDVAAPGERMNHDEFMRRTLELTAIPESYRRDLALIGQLYLSRVRGMDPEIKAMALASYEDGGLEKVFRAILTAPKWSDPLLGAFKHFLSEHIRFDSDPGQGHGALCRHITPDDRILPLWTEFKEMLIAAVPRLKASDQGPARVGVT